MAGFLSKIKDFVGVEDSVFEESDIDSDGGRGISDERRTPRQSRRGLDEDVASQERIWDAPKSTPARSAYNDSSRDRERENVISMPKAYKDITGQLKIVVIEPKSFEECPKLVDSLKARKPVIINLEKIETETAKKIFFFLNGATCALNGNVQKIANNIFVFVPENVDIATNTEHKGFNFGNEDNPWKG
ncbi:MAG: cell division protein SepF [Clostridiales Family XIII bacterium]|jgi:cell division inhibitor SepF|nr:cell division protein SepF [Clostridiales Family XIII bacterium]